MNPSRTLITLTLAALLGSTLTLHAQTAPPATQPAPTGKWINISGALADIAGRVKEPGVTGLVVDPTTGDLYVGYGHAGIWKSTDQGQTFTLSDGGRFNAMGCTPYSCDADPEGGRLVFWGMYGRSMITLDSGKTWSVAGDGHHDWGSIDWSDPAAKTMWVCPHGGNVISFDAGKTWNKKAEDKINGFGIFDSKTFAGLLVDAVFLSTDPPNDFVKKTRKIAPAPETCMRVFKGIGYWVSPQGLLVSKDKGQTWQIQGQPLPNPIGGPYFGENANHMMVVTKENFLETLDGGQHWTPVAPALGDPHWSTDKGETQNCRYFAWDPQHGILYGGKLRDSAMKFVLPEKILAKAPVANPNEPKPAPQVFERKPDAPVAPDTMVIWDGDRTFPKAFGYSDPKDKNTFAPQTDEVHQGKVALELHIAATPEGAASVFSGFNWHGWYPDDSGEDITAFTHFVFWIKVEKGKKIDRLDLGLTSSKPRQRSAMLDLTRYTPDALDGQWHQVAIPVSDLIAQDSKFNPKKAWELDLETRSDPAQLPYSIFFDDIALEKRPVNPAATAPAAR
jgi:hypothetical protein